MISIKIHKSYRDVVAIADEDLIGKVFEEGKRQLNVKSNFYKDKVLTQEEIIKVMEELRREDATFNIVGKESIMAAITAGIISEEGILEIENIPFALTLL